MADRGQGLSRHHWAGIRNAVIILAVWEVLGRFDLVAGGALPAPSEILTRFWEDRGDYPGHVLATLWGSSLGFLFGNVIAILAGVLFVLSPVASRLSRGVNIAIFSVPSIAIAPILALTLSGLTPRVVLAAIGCYFVTMTATMIGLTQIDQRSADVVRAYGGRSWKTMRLVRCAAPCRSYSAVCRSLRPAPFLEPFWPSSVAAGDGVSAPICSARSAVRTRHGSGASAWLRRRYRDWLTLCFR